MTRTISVATGTRDLVTGRRSGAGFVIQVSVAGAVSPRTGVMANIKELDRLMRGVAGSWDNGDLADDPALANEWHTPERLAVHVAGAVAGSLPPNLALSGVTVAQVPGTTATFAPPEDRGPKECVEVEMTRSYEFAASHRLHSNELTAAENTALFGKCNRPNGHGHNYVVDVSVAGPISQENGHVMPPADLDEIVEANVLADFDHAHLNEDVDDFRTVIPSGENIAAAIWRRLASRIPGPARLNRIVLHETARNKFEYSEEGTPAT